MTVLRYRERPRREVPEAFDLRRKWVEARSSGKAPTLKPHGTADNELPDNSNAKPQRSKVSFAGKATDPENRRALTARPRRPPSG